MICWNAKRVTNANTSQLLDFIHISSSLLTSVFWNYKMEILPICGLWELKLNGIIFVKHLVYTAAATAAAESPQSCPTLCDPIDGSPPGSPVPGILQARTLEWVAISFSNAWKWSLSRLLATPWTAAYQAPLSMGFSRQEYWSGLPLPSPERALSYLKWAAQDLNHDHEFWASP